MIQFLVHNPNAPFCTLVAEWYGKRSSVQVIYLPPIKVSILKLCNDGITSSVGLFMSFMHEVEGLQM